MSPEHNKKWEAVLHCDESFDGRFFYGVKLIFSLERPDIVSWGDLAIRRGMTDLYGLTQLTKEQFDRYRKRHSPFGSVASLYLWALAARKPVWFRDFDPFPAKGLAVSIANNTAILNAEGYDEYYHQRYCADCRS